MKRAKNLMDRIDEIRASSVSDEEYKRVWKRSLDEQARKMAARWDELLSCAKEAVDAQRKA